VGAFVRCPYLADSMCLNRLIALMYMGTGPRHTIDEHRERPHGP
jgi:hypothetical protein